jgi:hypothetical protein
MTEIESERIVMVAHSGEKDIPLKGNIKKKT